MLTLRELMWAYEAKRQHDWSQSAELMTLLANCHRNPKKQRRAFRLTDFLPPDLARKVRRANSGNLRLTTKNLRMLKPIFEERNGQP